MTGQVYGYIDEYRDGVLTGWCRIPNNDDIVSVDIVVNGTKVITVRADIYREDLYELGFGSGKHGFCAVLPQTTLDTDTRVHAVVAGTDLALENSGRRLADLGVEPFATSPAVCAMSALPAKADITAALMSPRPDRA